MLHATKKLAFRLENVLDINRRGGHLGHVTKAKQTCILPTIRIIYMIFEFNWPIGCRGNMIKNVG